MKQLPYTSCRSHFSENSHSYIEMRHLSNLEMRQSPTFTARALVNSKLERKAFGPQPGGPPFHELRGALLRVGEKPEAAFHRRPN